MGGESEERRVLGTTVVQASLAPVSVEFLFDQVLPRNRCRECSVCTAVMDDVTFQYWVDIPLYDGAFVELREQAVEREDTTTCSGLSEQAEESNLTDDNIVFLTQLDFRQFQSIRRSESGRSESGRPISLLKCADKELKIWIGIGSILKKKCFLELHGTAHKPCGKKSWRWPD